MIIQSFLIGILFGALWATMFSAKAVNITPQKQSSHTNSIITAILRYILLALLLGFLVIKGFIVLLWWLVGFMIAFWASLLFAVQKPTGN